MIGVLSKPGEAAEIREFFELFKTPWEFYQESGCYDAVIVTTETVPALSARVVLVYGPDLKQGYGQDQVAQGSQVRKGVLNWKGTQIPIYGTVQTLTAEEPIFTLAENGAVAGVRVRTQNGAVYRFGYDLFGEIRHLLGEGQPAEYAHIPTLDLHIDLLRQTILKEGLILLFVSPMTSISLAFAITSWIIRCGAFFTAQLSGHFATISGVGYPFSGWRESGQPRFRYR
jgi:hypothetical protein